MKEPELKKIIEDATFESLCIVDEKTPSIEEAIDNKKENEVKIDDSFDKCFNLYNDCTKHKNDLLKYCRGYKRVLYLNKVKSLVLNSNNVFYIDESIKKIDEVMEVIHKDQKFLYKIHDSLEILRMWNTIECNETISNIISLIDYKLMLIERYLLDQLSIIDYSKKGIIYSGDERIEEKINNIDNTIIYHNLTLGISK